MSEETNAEARGLLQRTIHEKTQQRDAAKKEVLSAERKKGRYSARLIELGNEISGLKAALDALGGPLTVEKEQD